MTRIGGLVGAVQKGISKKSNKPYALATLEDLAGSVQVLCLNENYEKFIDLLVPNKAAARHRRGQSFRGQAEDFPAGDHSAGGRAARFTPSRSICACNSANSSRAIWRRRAI